METCRMEIYSVLVHRPYMSNDRQDSRLLSTPSGPFHVAGAQRPPRPALVQTERSIQANARSGWRPVASRRWSQMLALWDRESLSGHFAPAAWYASWHHWRIMRISILRASWKHGGFRSSENMRSR
jgi:hypothetical protein